MKTAISLPDDLFGAAERTAERLGLTRSELFRKALIAFLRGNDERLVTEALNQVYVDDPQGSELDADIREIQAQSVARDAW